MHKVAAIALVAIAWFTAPAMSEVLDIDADTDRTGAIEGTSKEDQSEKVSSVLLLNNCDCDGVGGHDPDNWDGQINGDLDRDDMEPILLRQCADAERVSLKLKAGSGDNVPVSKRVRIFDPNGRELLGPAAGESAQLPKDLTELLKSGTIELHAEGLEFATAVELEAYVGEELSDSVRLQVAPLIFTPHSLAPVENYVCSTPSSASQQYVSMFKEACVRANVTPVVIQSPDVWVQDELTWGYSETPRKTLPVAFHMLRRRQLEASVKGMLGPDRGWAQAFRYSQQTLPNTSLTYGGNVEVTPPTDKHPFGRVYFGSQTLPDDPRNTYIKRGFHQQFRDFFLRNSASLQPPISLHTNWLLVGHIDELVSFVPSAKDGNSVMLIASPKLAVDILRALPDETSLDPRYDLEFGLRTVRDIFRAASLQRTLEEYNMAVDRLIFGPDHGNPSPGSIKGILQAELGLEERQIIEVPALFFNEDRRSWAALALTPGIVNLSSMMHYSLIPDPHIPEFRTATESQLSQHGCQVIWIDDWAVYHVNDGEVHCGSHERRNPFVKKWWQ